MKPIVGILIATLTLLSACQTTISGTIRDETGDPVYTDGKVNVTYLTDNGQTTYILDIATDGSFSTDKELKPGEYLVEPLIPGYEYGSSRITLDSSQTLVFNVKKLALPKIPTFKANPDVKLGRGEGTATITPPMF